MDFLNTILSYIFGDRCIVCRTESRSLCSECIGSFPETELSSASWIFPLYDYRHPSVKKTIHFLKYKSRSQIAKILATAMHARIMEELSDMKSLENFKSPLFIPIPLSKKRYRERGYNQSELLSLEIIKLSNNILQINTSALIKTRETKHQTDILDRTTRLKNISGTFSVCHPENVIGRNIILIDDVTTTGATLLEAKNILEKAGARTVIAFTFAH